MTIKDLAALSGYSLGTVSRVLNNQPHVSEKAREQIMAIVKEQGFELNTNARNLKQTHSNNILVIVRGTHNELFAALVERLQTVATGGEYQLVVDYIGELDNEVRRAMKRVREVKPQGILFLGGSSQDFSESFAGIRVPSVLLRTPPRNFISKTFQASRPTIQPRQRRPSGIWRIWAIKNSLSSAASAYTPTRAVCAVRAYCARLPSAA